MSIAFLSLYVHDHLEKVRITQLSLPLHILFFFLYLLPWLTPAAILFVAWRWELAGGIIYMVIGGLGFFCVGLINLTTPEHAIDWAVGLITAPAFVTGLLFYIGWLMKRRNKTPRPAELSSAASSDILEDKLEKQ